MAAPPPMAASYNLWKAGLAESREAMNPKQPKKMLIMDSLEILRKYSDAEHRLSQKDIIDLLESKFGMKADRKAVAHNIADLIDEGYAIGYREVPRTT